MSRNTKRNKQYNQSGKFSGRQGSYEDYAWGIIVERLTPKRWGTSVAVKTSAAELAAAAAKLAAAAAAAAAKLAEQNKAAAASDAAWDAYIASWAAHTRRLAADQAEALNKELAALELRAALQATSPSDFINFALYKGNLA